MARFGDLDTQYLDDAGNPLVNGKVYFYESGTTTLKNTFADVNLSIPNTNPVILTAAGRQPNIFFDGVAKAILTSNSDVQILVRDPVGETATDFGDEWVATKIYGANDVVLGSDGVYYRSLVSGNQNNNPVSTTNFWTLLYSVEWNAGITYQVGAVVTYDGEQYQSLQGSNLNQNPSTASSYWVLLSFAWLATATYAEDQNAVGTDGILYTSLQNGNIGNDPATSPAYWVGTSAAAAASAVAAAASAAAALVSENAAAADAIATAADVVQTGLDAAATAADAIATAADRVQTGLDAAATAADVILTNADAVATAADRVQTGLDAAATSADAIATAADRVQTGLDVIATNADAIATAADAIATAADVVQTGLDVVATSADVVQTGLDVTAAAGSASAASGSASAAAGSAAAAAASYDAFDDRYLGDKASDPTLDNDGNALLTGALYFNTTSDVMKVYDGSAWNIAAISSASPTFTGTVTADGLVVNGAAVFNEGGGDNDFRVESDTSTHAFFLEGSSGNVGIGVGSPSGKLDIQFTDNTTWSSSARADGYLQIYNTSTTAGTYSGIELLATGTGSVGAAEIVCIDSGSGSGDLAFSTRSIGTWGEKLRITSSGNVGIGTTSPTAKLHVVGNAGITAERSGGASITMVAGSGGEARLDTSILARAFQVNPNGVIGLRAGSTLDNGDADFTLDTSGNVGIGTSSPDSGGLHIDTSGGTLTLERSGTGFDAKFKLIAGGLSGGGLRIQDSTTDRFTIDGSGNIGIGTTSPSSFSAVGSNLVIGSTASGDTGLSLITNSTSTNNICFGDATTTGDASRRGKITYDHSDNSMSFDTLSSERMRINSSGNVGIGTSSPDQLLHIAALSNPTLRIENTDTTAAVNQTIGKIEFEGQDASTNASGVRAEIEAQYGGVGGTSRLIFKTTAESSTTLSNSIFLSYSTQAFYTGNTERMRIDSSGNVGIGTSNPARTLHVENSSGNLLQLKNSSTANDSYASLEFITTGGGNSQIRGVQEDASNSYLNFFTKSGGSVAEAMRITSGGSLLVNTTTTTPAVSNDTNGIALQANGTVQFSANATTTAIINRKATDGDILQFRKDGTTVGSIGSVLEDSLSRLYIAQSDTGLKFNNGPDYIVPCTSSGANRDNVIDLGASAARFTDIYATNGTIQTSDRNEKQDIEALTEAETRVAIAAKGLLRKFRWQSAVEEKGDDARIHFGIIAQDLQAAFEAEGLDAGRYAMFIHSTWTDEETGEERSRMGVRYSELLAFIIAAL